MFSELGWVRWGCVALGGALGSLARVALQTAVAPWSLRFPWGTLSANVLGSFFIGFLAARWVGLPAHSEWRLFAIAGVLGGFTTFSSFSLESLNLLRSERYGAAIGYTLGSLALGLVFAAIGYALGRSGSQTI
jgi:fluoride exporter